MRKAYTSHAASSWPRLRHEETVNGRHMRMVQYRDGRCYVDMYTVDCPESYWTSRCFYTPAEAEVYYAHYRREFQITTPTGKDVLS